MPSIKLLDFYSEEDSDCFLGRALEIKELELLINKYSLIHVSDPS